jgi:hypothetical protein
MEAIMSNTLQPIELTDSDLDAVSGGGYYNKQVAIGTGWIKTGDIKNVFSWTGDNVTGVNNTGNQSA